MSSENIDSIDGKDKSITEVEEVITEELVTNESDPLPSREGSKDQI